MPLPPNGSFTDDWIAPWLAAVEDAQRAQRVQLVPANNPTNYYAVAFWTQDGFSVKQGVTVNTLVAGP